MRFDGEISGLEEGLALLKERLNCDLFKATVDFARGECLVVKGDNGCYRLEYSTSVECFRGLALLAGSLRMGEQAVDITEKRKFDTCGVMIDCSRNAVLKPEKVREILCKMACIGLNRLMLYTEDTYRIDGYPYFGYMRGAYTKEEIKEMDRTAGVLGIEMVPCIQTLAHLRMALRWPFADKIRDTAEVLMIGEEETYQLIDAMFRSVKESFSTDIIHIGMDEAWDVGLGNYLKKYGYQNRFEMLSAHLNRVMELANKHGLKPMMWSDMFFRLGCKEGGYYDETPVFPGNIQEMIPEGLSMVYWDYYNTSEADYERMINNHRLLGRKLVFAGGIWIWSGMGVQYDQTFTATDAALKACRKAGVKDVFATMWGDDGAENNIDNTWLGMQLYGEYQYHETVSHDHLKKRFRQCLGYDMEAFLCLQVDNYPEQWRSGNVVSVSKEVLYQDILCGLFDKNFEGLDLKGHYQKGLEKLECCEIPEGLELLFEYQKQLRRVLAEKCDIGLQLKNAYQNREELSGYITKLKQLYQEVEDLHRRFTILWESSNKVFGLDLADLRFGGLLMRINTAVRRLEQYIDGEILEIPELEEEKLLYGINDASTGKTLVGEQRHSKIAYASSSW